MPTEKRDAEVDFKVVGEMAAWLGVAEEELESFVTEAMTRRGHKPVTGWKNAEGEGESSKPDNVFGLTRGGTKKASGGSNWQYGG